MPDRHASGDIPRDRDPGACPYPDDSFDVVYACSVFSHLPETLHLLWLAEIRRVLRPGGVLVATTLSESAVRFAAEARARGEYAAV